MLRAIFFDLDQTLLDRTETFRRYLNRQFTDLNLTQYGLSEDDYQQEINRWDNNGYRPKSETFGFTVQTLGLPITTELLLSHFNREYGQDAQLFPGVKTCLQAWHRRLPMALITNGRTVGQRTKLQVTGIEPLFKTVLISESVGVKKPDPKIYQAACEAMGVEPNDVLFVGDHPQNDVETPKQLGMRAVWVRSPAYQAPQNHDGIVDRVVDLPTVIDF